MTKSQALMLEDAIMASAATATMHIEYEITGGKKFTLDVKGRETIRAVELTLASFGFTGRYVKNITPFDDAAEVLYLVQYELADEA